MTPALADVLNDITCLGQALFNVADPVSIPILNGRAKLFMIIPA
jgi:hypothetical protein